MAPTDVTLVMVGNVALNTNGNVHGVPNTPALVERQAGFQEPAPPNGTAPDIFVFSWYACSTPAALLMGYCVRAGPAPTTTLMS